MRLLLTSAACIAFALLSSGCKPRRIDSTVKEGAARPIGQMRGTAAINQILGERLLAPETVERVDFSVESLAGVEIYRLRALMGQWDSGGERRRFNGGEPNPMGALLWYKVMSSLSGHISEICNKPAAEAPKFAKTVDGMREVQPEFSEVTRSQTTKLIIRFEPAVAISLHKLCGAPTTEAEYTQNLDWIWQRIMTDEAPVPERDAWKAYVTGMTTAKPNERLADAMLAMFMNPNFLLER